MCSSLRQNLQDELEDLTEQSSEIQEVMGRSYGMPEVDDEDLEAELDALGDEIGLDEDSSYLDQAVETPSVPTSEPGDASVRVSCMLLIKCCLTEIIHRQYHLPIFNKFLKEDSMYYAK